MNNNLLNLSKYLRNTLINNNYKYNKRIKKTNILDGFMFNLLYTQKGKTQDTVSGDLNSLNQRFNKNSIRASRQAFSARNKLLPVDFYKDTYESLCKYIDNKFYNDKYSYQVCAVDGTDNNLRKALKRDGFKTNKNDKSITALNLGIYNVTRNYPVTLEMVKHKNERKAFLDFTRDKGLLKNHIFVFDRGFDGIHAIMNMHNRGLKYICRIKENSTWINSEKNDNIIIENGVPIRIITYKINDSKYYLATNLFDDDEFSVEKLKQLYHDRWTVEEMFKYIKANFNFSYINVKDEDSIRKSIYGQLIIARIACLLVKIYGQRKCKNTKKGIINKKTLTDGLFREYLYLLVNGKLNRRNISQFAKNYIIVITTGKGKSVPHECHRPYMKWYIKQYFKRYTKSSEVEDG